MGKNISFMTATALVSVLGLIAAPTLTSAQYALPHGAEMKRVIVVFHEGVDTGEQQALLDRFGALKKKELSLIHGAAVEMPAVLADRLLKNDPRVLRVDEDVEVHTFAQTMPWGIADIKANQVWPTGNIADPIKVAVIDTGISTRHADLSANIKGGINYAGWYPSNNFNDDNGHGSHVAGTIAAVNNTTGVVGAAHRADLYGVKVLDASGSGYLSDIIAGLDWAVANKMQVANMSLGTTANVQSFHDAITRAYDAGIVLVAAAGNDGGAVNYPAAYLEVIAVSATDQTHTIASWSSRGTQVALAAPGVGVYSTYKGKGYATLSGTSMATPHVTATAALVLGTPITAAYDLDTDGIWDPSEVRQKLIDTATDLGNTGKDDLYGYGLVNALAAVQ